MISIFNIFKIGIGPSSSHTVGPMAAAREWLLNIDPLSDITKVEVLLYGSLALTGKGHGTDVAIKLGLLGEIPDQIDTRRVEGKLATIADTGQIALLQQHSIPFTDDHIQFLKRDRLPAHSNGMRFVAYGPDHLPISDACYYSIGGGFIATSEELENEAVVEESSVPFEFKSGEDLLDLCQKNRKNIADIVAQNEEKLANDPIEIDQKLGKIWDAMKDCVDRGVSTEGILPGGLNVKRRAAKLYRDLQSRDCAKDPALVMDWVSCFALAVNEENAAGGQVVTAPTNGAAGIIPAVLHYYDKFVKPLTINDLRTFFFTSGAIGFLYKTNASISGAEMGCQGEVGVACSMAAAGLAALRGATPSQIENAAEIGMEHNLGLTCDPVKGLVQIPCIERNTMGAIKAINAARLAMMGDGTQKVSLDKVIKTMKATGMDMKKRYKETSKGGLAINITEC